MTTATDEQERRKKRRRRVVLAAVQLVFLAVAVTVLVRRSGSLGSVADLLHHVRWTWVALEVAAQAGAILALAALQRQLLGCGGTRVRIRRMMGVTLASNAVAQSVPAGAVFAEGYAYRQYRRLGADRVQSAWVGLASGALGVAALAGVGLAGALLTGGSLGDSVAPVAAVVFVGAATVSGFFRRPAALSRVLRWSLIRAQRFLRPGWRRTGESVADDLSGMNELHPSVASWATAGGLAGLNWLADCMCLFCAAKAVEAPVPWRAILLAFAAGQLLTMFPLTPGGLGVVEGGLTVVLSQLGTPPAASTAAAIAYRAVSFWLLVLVGWLAALTLAVRDRDRGRGADSRRPRGRRSGSRRAAGRWAGGRTRRQRVGQSVEDSDERPATTAVGAHVSPSPE